MADISAFLSPQDRAKLARSIGIPMGDGRAFRNGVVVSSADAQRTAETQQRNALFTQQTAGYRASQEMLQREQARAGQPSPQFLPPAGQPTQPQAPVGQPQQPPTTPAQPSADMMNRATLISNGQPKAQEFNPQLYAPDGTRLDPSARPSTGIAVAAGPNFSPNGPALPDGSIGYQTRSGYVVNAPLGPGVGNTTFPSGGAARSAFQGAPSARFLPQSGAPVNAPAPLPAIQAPNLADKTYTAAEVNRMTPEQRASRVAWDQQNAARAAATARETAEVGKINAETEALKNKPAATPDAFDVAYTAFKQSNPAATPEQTQKFIDDYRSKGTPQTNVNVGEGLIGKAYSGYEKSRNDIIAADETLSTLDEAVKEIESGKAFTGTGSGFKLQGAKIAQLLGSEQFNDEIAATEALASTIAQAALSQIQRLPGPASDKDIKFIQAASTGSSTLPGKETLRRIREIMARTVERNKARYQQDIERTFTGDDQNAQFAKRSLALGGPAQAATSSTGQTQPRIRRYNPATGTLE